ncbi:hypothetical protein NA56DRAFT_702870 [Hyaloscypha hepaticicola]|uniref:Uncharacterized protein n=1 Tax=Hyaloscypha hepaticicola TaxID=2082293 RepID=A0A2J6Q6K0_9HELO|nr:hypothetical protein NA56DRAFT_702870 [Hyaloscypha hepaticicola]
MSPIPLPINTPSTTYFSNLTYRNITQKNLKPTLHRTIALRLDVAVTEQSRRADRMIELFSLSCSSRFPAEDQGACSAQHCGLIHYKGSAKFRRDLKSSIDIIPRILGLALTVSNLRVPAADHTTTRAWTYLNASTLYLRIIPVSLLSNPFCFARILENRRTRSQQRKLSASS